MFNHMFDPLPNQIDLGFVSINLIPVKNVK